MELTVENLEEAVSHFYRNSATQSQLNVWLTAAQSSAQAWTFGWQLLDQSKVNIIRNDRLNSNFYSLLHML